MRSRALLELRRILCSAAILPLILVASCTSTNPVAPPSPLAEIPAALVIPSDLSIEVNEIGTGGPSAFKVQTTGGLRDEIEGGPAIIEEDNEILDLLLSPFDSFQIPVDPALTNFRTNLSFSGGIGDDFLIAEGKFDFTPFDLNQDGQLEVCSGCTCPVACAPAISTCPAEAPEEQLQPICMRIWVDGERFMAGVFNRVPTLENAESGTFRVIVPSEPGFDLNGSFFAFTYDQRDPENRTLDLMSFLIDEGLPEFFGRRHDIISQIGPEATSKKTVQLQTETFDPIAGLLQYQGQFFTHLDFILLEIIAEGVFGTEDEGGILGLDDFSPPICAKTSTSSSVPDILCDDLELALTAGAFPDLPELNEVQPPPFSDFPETPGF